MKKHFLFLLLLVCYLTCYGEVMWQREINNFTQNQYEPNAQNWMIKRSAKGWIYAANSDGLLEYDGENWTLYENKNKMIRSIHIKDERIYVGGSAEFGYYEKNTIGKLVYRSLSADLGDWGGEVWYVLENGSEIYFISDEYIHSYNIETDHTQAIIQVHHSTKIHSAAIISQKLYLGCVDGLYCLENKALQSIESSKDIADGKIIEILPLHNKLLLVTAEKGLYTLEGENIRPLPTIASAFIKQNRLFSAAIQGNMLALGSVQHGLFLFDIEKNANAETFNLQNGLNNNTILGITFDTYNNLWLALDNGISQIKLDETNRPLFSNTSPIGTGYASIEYKGEFYFGTNQGLYKYGKDGNSQIVNNIQGQIWALTIIGDDLFCSGDNAIYVFSSNGDYTIPIVGVWDVYSPKGMDNLMLATTYTGIFVLGKTNNRWQYEAQVSNFHDSMRGFIEDVDKHCFWFVRQKKYISRMQFSEAYDEIINIKTYPIPGHDSQTELSITQIYNDIVVYMPDGIFIYNKINDSFEPYKDLEAAIGKSKIYKYIGGDKYNNIWYYTNTGLSTLFYINGLYNNRPTDWNLRNDLVITHHNIANISGTTSFVVTSNAFVKLDASYPSSTPIASTYIRKIIDSRTQDVLLYISRGEEKLKIPYHSNSLRFEFASNDFDLHPHSLYTYKLVGQDEHWSSPSESYVKEYTNLGEGYYTFKVKSVNGETSSVEDSFSFIILPPWYRSPVAYLLYTLGFTLGVYFLYRKTVRKQKIIIDKQKQEQVLKDKKIYELQNENLTAELQYKSQELAGYIINVSQKNEMLEEVKKSVQNISKAIDEQKKQVTLKQMTTLLVSFINKNLKRDDSFKVFESNFDIVHKNFLKKLDSKYPHLSKNDKMLCAYLKMNLSSKEIAPIQGISVRSVEVSRYRLRKKLDMESDENLNKFLQNLEKG